jgi:crotonobetainyl-CoA:carnitine CoA-transferase CaiB-like acyl-CoA transferase
MRTALTGCRVLELGGYVAAPFGALVLRHLGADVIKVESPTGDPTRVREANFVANNAGKRSLVLDLRNKSARPVWNRLVESSNVIIQNLDDSATGKLAIGYQECRVVNPSIVYCHIKAFGPGPYSNRPATNPIVEALTGIMSITWADGKPARQGASFYDQMAGLFSALSVVVSLTAENQGTVGEYIETDLFETGLFSVAPRLADYAINNELAGEVWGTAPYDTFRTADGHWIFLGVVNDSLWISFCAAMGLTEAGEDPGLATSAQRLARKSDVDQLAAAAIAQLSREEALAILQNAGIPCAPVNNFKDALGNEHVRTPGKLYRASYGGRESLLPSFPVVGATNENEHSAVGVPALGEHSAEILTSLGYEQDDLSALVADGIVCTDKGRAAGTADSVRSEASPRTSDR